MQSFTMAAVIPRSCHTRRVGRVLVRKLVLRGYNVRVLVRNKAQVLGILPSSVGIIEGDVGNPESFRAAVEGIDKASWKHTNPFAPFQHLSSLCRQAQTYRTVRRHH